MNPKITLIGAGSVVFAKTLIGDILQRPELAKSTICLMDIDPARLKVAEAMAKKMIATLGVGAKVEATLDRRTAVKNANYVICTIQVGGYKPGTVIDFEIPKKYGLRQTIADTLGIGGIFRSLRTIPAINAIGRDMAEVGAPNCMLLNYTNPMAMNCWAFDREIGLPHVGLCHSVQGTSQQLARYAGIPIEDVDYLVAGINHMAFFLKYTYKGQDAYPLLFRALNQPETARHDRVRFEMMRRLGYFITESSEHLSEYVPYFIHHGQGCIDAFDIPLDEYIRRCEVIIKSWKKSEAKLLGEGDSKIDIRPPSHEYGAAIIHSRETGKPSVIYGNVPNRGLITNLPDGCCVEVPCLVDAQGIQPTVIGNLPEQCAALCRTNVNVQALTVEAALTNKRDAIYHAAMLDPHCAATLPLDKIWALCDDLIEAHQKAGLLGEFAPVIPGTGRPLSAGGETVIAEIVAAKQTGRAKEGEMPVAVTVTNPRAKAAKVRVTVSAEGGKARIVGSRSVSVSVPAGKTVSKNLRVTGLGREGATIALSTTQDGVLCKDLHLKPRLILDATPKDGCPVELFLAGFPAVEGRITATAGEVVLRAMVHDSKPEPEPEKGSPWDGTCVELFFANRAETNIRQFFIIPWPGKRAPVVINSSRKKAEGIKASQKITPAGYELTVRVDRAKVGLTDTTELIDLIAAIGALGDAHSGGRTALGGAFHSWQQASHYAELRLPPANA